MNNPDEYPDVPAKGGDYTEAVYGHGQKYLREWWSDKPHQVLKACDAQLMAVEADRDRLEMDYECAVAEKAYVEADRDRLIAALREAADEIVAGRPDMAEQTLVAAIRDSEGGR